MEGWILESGEFREEGVDEQGKLPIAVGVRSPVIGGQHRRDRNRVHLLLLIRDQVGVFLRRQSRWQVVALQRLVVFDRNKMKPVVLDLGDGLGGFALYGNHGIDPAGPQFLQRDTLFDINEIRFDSEPLEHDQSRDEGSAIRKVDADGLALEIPEAAYRFRRDDMHLFIVKLGHVGELVLDVLRDALLLEIVERIGAHDAEIDTLENQNVGDALDRAAADNRQHAQLVSVVEHRGEVRAELNIGAADGAG